MSQLDVLAIAAHPDDTELCCGGTLASLAAAGRRVGVLDLTRGEMGTRGTPDERLAEAREAARILGLHVRENAGLPDCGLENTAAHREVIIRCVRRYRPAVCVVNAPSDRHPDHGNAARLSIDALFYSGLQMLATTGHDGRAQQPWRPLHILHFMQNEPFVPTFVYDISDQIERKEQAILAFRSQFNVPDDDPGPQTFVSGEPFFESIRARARMYGQQIGVRYGEPFLYHGGPVPLTNLDVLFASRPLR